MKRCPVCSRTYSDDQNFCFDDGTTLVAAPPSPFDISEVPTANYPYGSGAPPTNIVQGTPTTSGRPYGTSPPPPPPPSPAFMMPYAQPKRSPLPWIVGGLLVLIVGIAAILFISKNNSGQTTTNTGGTTPAASPSYSPTTTTTTSSSSWQTISEDGFTITMPGTPSKNDDTVPSAAGPLMLRMYTLSKGYEGYITGYTVYPDMVFNASEPEEMMDNAQNAAINNIQGEVTSQHKITVKGNPGREIVGTSPSKNIGFTARVILARPRMYMLIYTQYDKSKQMSDDGKKFLDSFQITK